MKNKSSLLLAASAFLAFAALSPAHAVDEDAAKSLFKKEKCTKCHSADKSKTGPSLQKIAEKYKGKAEGEAAVVKAMTSGAKVKLDDGSQEEHAIMKNKDAGDQKNLAQWILSH